jgi:hypothetical protein
MALKVKGNVSLRGMRSLNQSRKKDFKGKYLDIRKGHCLLNNFARKRSSGIKWNETFSLLGIEICKKSIQTTLKMHMDPLPRTTALTSLHF